MSGHPNSSEEALCAAFQRQADHYLAALSVARELFQNQSRWQDDVRSLERIQGHLQDVQRIDQDVVQARQNWQRTGQRPSQKLQTILDELKPVVQELLACVEAAERRANQAKALLAPKLDTQAQTLRMRRAYSATELHG